MGSLTHADEAQPGGELRSLDIEANAVIDYLEAEILIRTNQTDGNAFRAAVLHCIMQCFLQHAKKSQSDRAVHFLLKMIAGTMNRNTQLLGAFAAVTLNGNRQTEQLQFRGMQVVREAADLVDDFFQLAVKSFRLAWIISG